MKILFRQMKLRKAFPDIYPFLIFACVIVCLFAHALIIDQLVDLPRRIIESSPNLLKYYIVIYAHR